MGFSNESRKPEFEKLSSLFFFRNILRRSNYRTFQFPFNYWFFFLSHFQFSFLIYFCTSYKKIVVYLNSYLQFYYLSKNRIVLGSPDSASLIQPLSPFNFLKCLNNSKIVREQVDSQFFFFLSLPQVLSIFCVTLAKFRFFFSFLRFYCKMFPFVYSFIESRIFFFLTD